MLFPAYATFFEELIYAKPQILVTYSEAIKSLAVKMANAHIDQSFFGILNAVFEVLNIGDLKSSGWMNFHVASLMSVVSSIPADIGGQSYRPLYFKEYAFLILKFGLKHSFTGIFRTNSGYFMAVESEQKGTTAAVLSFQPLHVFMRFFKRIPEVRIVTLGLTKLLTEDFGVFQELGITEIWQMLFVTLLRNIFSRSSMATGSLKQNWDNIARTNEVQTSSDVLQQRHMQQIKGLGDNSAFTRLQALAPKPDKVLLQIKDMKESDMRVSMDRVREFLKGPGSNLNYDFLDQYLKELIDKFPN